VKKDEPWYVYILGCGDGSLYTGIARDVEARLRAHASGRGARYTRGRGPLRLLHVEPADSQGSALRREAAIRRLRRADKMRLSESATPSRASKTAARRRPTRGSR
jgi:putative endonuclease